MVLPFLVFTLASLNILTIPYDIIYTTTNMIDAIRRTNKAAVLVINESNLTMKTMAAQKASFEKN